MLPFVLAVLCSFAAYGVYMVLELLIKTMPLSDSTGGLIAFVVFIVTLIVGYANKKKVTSKTLAIPGIILLVVVVVFVVFRVTNPPVLPTY